LCMVEVVYELPRTSRDAISPTGPPRSAIEATAPRR
jgi:hypothetical protein